MFMKFENLTFTNETSRVSSNLRIDREKYVIIKVTFEISDNDVLNQLKNRARILATNTNNGAANSSKNRDNGTKYKDSLSGIIAEHVCVETLNKTCKQEVAHYTDYTGSINQIDIKLINDETIEVRSSCIKNGVDFALFSKNKFNLNEQYLDVLGPYSNLYKPCEIGKNYYMRVIFYCDKNDFITHLDSKEFAAYIVGGSTWSMMGDSNYYQDKNLIPEGSDIQTKTFYRVIPIGKALDAIQLLDIIKNSLE